MEALKNFSQAEIEQTIAGAVSQLTGGQYTAEIKSKESVELSLAERNKAAVAQVYGADVVTEREKIVLILNKVGR